MLSLVVLFTNVLIKVPHSPHPDHEMSKNQVEALRMMESDLHVTEGEKAYILMLLGWTIPMFEKVVEEAMHMEYGEVCVIALIAITD